MQKRIADRLSGLVRAPVYQGLRLRFLLMLGQLAVAAAALASNGQIEVMAYPSMNVADAHSITTITVTVRDTNGRAVPDGTQVLFDTTLGSFRDPVATTISGQTQAVLIAGSIPGTAVITVKCLSFNATAKYEYDFVKDRSLLSSEKEFIEITGPKQLKYSFDQQIVGCSGEKQDVHVRYRDITVDADDIQFDTRSYELRARNARLKIGKRQFPNFSDLYMVLNQRKGIGTGTYDGLKVDPDDPFRLFGNVVRLFAQPAEVFGLVAINQDGVKPTHDTTAASKFTFQDLSNTRSAVYAKQAVIFPHKEIQFHRAAIYVDDTKIVSLPLYDVNLLQPTEFAFPSIVNVNDSSLAINYPQYIELKPGETSLIRLHAGDNYGRTFGSAHGIFLDYELDWNKGDDMDGGLDYSGLARKDWSLGVHQFFRLDPQSSIYGQVEVPAGKSLFGSASYSSELQRFSVSLSENVTQTFEGPKLNTQQSQFVVEHDPIKAGKLPLNLFYGATASYNNGSNAILAQTQSNYGLRVRAQSLPLRMGSQDIVNAGVSVSKLVGTGTPPGLAVIGSVSLSHSFSNQVSSTFTYSYTRDGFTDILLGRNEVSLHTGADLGKFGLDLDASKSLDLDREDLYGDASLHLFGPWRIASSFTFDRYVGQQLLDYYWVLFYRLGTRDVGLSWSRVTHRLGIQVLGAQFN